MQLEPKLEALLKKMGQDDLDDLKALLIPAMIEEVIALSPAGAQAIESMVFAAAQPVAQSALESLIGKIVL